MHPLPALEPRLQRRYQRLVQEHSGHAHSLAAGLRCLPGESAAFASTQAAWRFYGNPDVTMPKLAEPLLEHARLTVPQECRRFLLVAHDWSHLNFPTHERKADRLVKSGEGDVGYLLSTALLIGDQQGKPLSLMAMDLEAADGVHSSRHETLQPRQSNLDGLAAVMQFVADQGLGRPAVHIIDREADSVGHYRDWHQAGHLFLVRADDERVVRHEGEERSLRDIAERLVEQRAFRDTREVSYHGRPARQMVAETTVVLDRPAWRHRVIGGKKRNERLRGAPLTLRLVVTRIYDPTGKLLAQWLLLTNVPVEVDAAEIALWYYWRWRIESFFKLLKGAGQQVERWQQQTAAALARRLLVASMACVVVWDLSRRDDPAAAELRKLLVRLSGRQMKWGKEYTLPALLAGLWVLLSVLEVLEDHSLDELRNLAALVRGTRHCRPKRE